MPIRRSPNGAGYLRPQPGRDRPESVVAINRNARGFKLVPRQKPCRLLARDRFEAGLSEAAFRWRALWALELSVGRSMTDRWADSSGGQERNGVVKRPHDRGVGGGGVF
jgi:hypothetical protein